MKFKNEIMWKKNSSVQVDGIDISKINYKGSYYVRGNIRSESELIDFNECFFLGGMMYYY